jgi:DNA-binding response OmpR family regulator
VILVLLDLRLPRLDGLEVLRRIRATASTRDLPVVILTSDSSERDRVASSTLAVQAFTRKPLDFVEFAQTLGSLGLSLALTGGQ